MAPSISCSMLIAVVLLLLLVLRYQNDDLTSAGVDLPPMTCNLCSSIKKCSCGKYAPDGLFGSCKNCPSGYACGGYNRYTCKPGSFGRGKECAVDRAPEENYGYCTLCPANSYQPNSRQSTCLPCPANHEFVGTAATRLDQCTPCAEGFSSTPGDACVQCDFGEYVSAEGCQLCPSGTHYPLKGAANESMCRPCGQGRVSSTDRTTCVNCPAGSYQDQEIGTQCRSCPAGTASPFSGVASCPQCDYGFYNGGTRQTACTPAPAGYHVPIRGATTPTPCGPGRYSTKTGTVNCSLTRPGEYQPAQEATVPLSCPPGTFTNETDQSSCRPCEIGMFNDDTNQSSCTLCPAGSYADSRGLPQCRLCRPGSFGIVVGSKTVFDCKQASPGHYVDTDGASAEIACPAGTSSSMVGATHIAFCGKCLPGSFSVLPASLSCQKCPAGTANSMSGADSTDACANCPSGYFSDDDGAVSCSPCSPSTFQSTPGSTSCSPVGPGRFSPQASSQFYSCQPGFFCPNATGCENHCLYCGDHDGYSTASEATKCVKCPYGYGPNATATGCITRTISLTPSHSKQATQSDELTNSDEHTISITEELTANSSSATASAATPTKTRHTPSRNFTKTSSKSFSEGPSLSPEITVTKFSATSSPSASQDTHSGTYEETKSSTIYSVTADVTETMNSSTLSKTLSPKELSTTTSHSMSNPTETIKIYPKHKKLGLSEEEQKQMQQTTSITAALVGIVSAPTAMTMTRSMAILSLIGCPEKDPKERVQFPLSLLPGVGVGAADGFFHRGAALSFCVVFVLAFVVGFLNTETIGRPMDLNSHDEEENEENEENEEENKDNQHQRTRGQSFLERSKDIGKQITSKLEKFATARQVPRIVYIIISATLGLFATEAGLLFATFEPGDIAFAVTPLVVIFTFVIYMTARVNRSAQDREHGIFFTKSFVMMKSDEGKCKNLLIKPATAKSILSSPFGRFCFFGHYFWSRPKGKDSIEAQKLLLSLGSQVQKFRGPVCRTNFIETANPFFDSDSDDTSSSSDDEDDHDNNSKDRSEHTVSLQSSSETSHAGNSNAISSSSSSSTDKKKRDKKKEQHQRERNRLLLQQQKKNNNNKNKEPSSSPSVKVSTKVFADWEEKEVPKIEVREETNTLSARLSINYLLISWVLGGSCAFLEGVALTRTETCGSIALVILAENIFSALMVLWLRPFVVPVRNLAACLLEVSIGVTSIVIAATLLSNEENRFDDPQLARELDTKNAIARVVQMFNFVIGIIVSVIMAFSTISRWVLLNVGQCAAASHEEMWALRLMNDAEEEIERREEARKVFDFDGIDAEEMEEYYQSTSRPLPFSVASLSTKAARTRTKKMKEQQQKMKMQKKKNNNKNESASSSMIVRLFSSLSSPNKNNSGVEYSFEEEDAEDDEDFVPPLVSPIQKRKDEALMESLLLPKDKRKQQQITQQPNDDEKMMTPMKILKKQSDAADQLRQNEEFLNRLEQKSHDDNHNDDVNKNPKKTRKVRAKKPVPKHDHML